MATDVREAATRTAADDLLRDYHDARRREDQWRIPQILLALVTPILALIGVVMDISNLANSSIPVILAIITGTAAALIGIEVWRWHRIALSRVNEFRTSYPADAGLLLKDPI